MKPAANSQNASAFALGDNLECLKSLKVILNTLKEMPLHMIGLGLSDERDISVKGRDAVLQSKHVYLEMYTAILMISTERLAEYFGKEITVADR